MEDEAEAVRGYLDAVSGCHGIEHGRSTCPFCIPIVTLETMDYLRAHHPDCLGPHEAMIGLMVMEGCRLLQQMADVDGVDAEDLVPKAAQLSVACLSLLAKALRVADAEQMTAQVASQMVRRRSEATIQ